MEEGDRGDQEEKRGNQKGREQSSQVINSLFALHSLEHSERFTEFHREKKREEGDRGDQKERSGVKRSMTNLACDQFAKFSPQPRTPKEIHKVK